MTKNTKSYTVAEAKPDLAGRPVRPQHISRRLSASLIFTVTFLVSIVITIMYFRAIDIEEKALQAKADEYLAYVVSTIEIPLWNVDEASVQLIGNAVTQNELIIRLKINDETGEPIFFHEKDPDEAGLSRSAMIYHKDNPVGQVELRFTKRIYQQKNRDILLFHIISTFIILIYIWLTSGFFIRTFLKKPLERLNEIVRQYASGQYYFDEDQLPYMEFKPFGKVLFQMGKTINEQLASLQKAERRYRMIFEHAVEGIFKATPEGTFRNANAALAFILGYDTPQDLMTDVVDIRHRLYVNPSDRDRLIREIDQHGSVKGFETRMYTKDKRIIWVHMNIRGITDDDGNLAYLEGFLTDISDRVTADEEIKRHKDHLEELVFERTEELAEAKENAEAANAAKSDFLARMSHEIRTPLNAVTGLTNIVLKTELTHHQRDYLNKVLFAAKNLMNVINDILDFSKVEAGQMELAHAAFDLDAVLERMVDLFSNRAGQKKIELIFNITPQVPQRFLGDVDRICQVLTNLIANAIKFTDQGEVVVGVKPVDASVDAPVGTPIGRTDGPDTKTGLIFSVSDTGTGIAPDILPTLFDPFTQADISLTRKHEGTGLGLAICQRLVELMGGKIGCKSVQGEGSRFYFCVWLETVKHAASQYRIPQDLHGAKTLVVDDSAAARKMMEDLLTSFSFRVTTVASGKEAIAALNTNREEPYRLVLLDWKMPGMDGMKIARAIIGNGDEHQFPDVQTTATRVLPKARQTRPIIIMVTAYGKKMLASHIEIESVDAWLAKPIKPSLLFNTIMELTGNKTALLPPASSPLAHLSLRILTDRRVLVAEDSDLNRTVILALLKGNGAIVESVDNGKLAVEQVTGAPWHYYDAVLMDIQMPVMDGYEATRLIRQWESEVIGPVHRHTASGRGAYPEASANVPIIPGGRKTSGRLPIIAITAHALTGEKEKCLAAGMDDYLSKPIDEKRLESVLLKWIEGNDAKMAEKAPQKPSRTTDAAEILDVRGAVQRLGGRTELYEKIVVRFRSECEKAHMALTEYLAEKDHEAASRTAHTVKGASASIGAMALSQIAAELEQEIAQHVHRDHKDLLAEFDAALQATFKQVETYLSMDKGNKAKIF